MQSMNFNRGSELCLACGLCCNGALSDIAILLPDEFEFAQAMGMKPDRNGDKQFVHLPCLLYRDGECTIYPRRIHICKVSDCNLLENYKEGLISLELASTQVQKCKQQYVKIREELGAQENQSFWEMEQSFQKQCSESLDFRRQNAGLLLEITSLTRLIYKLFVKK